MKAIFAILSTTTFVFAHPPKCNADNCARAVTGTFQGAERSVSRVSTDCVSFQKATAYPKAVTVTITSGKVKKTIQPPIADTTIVPTSVPDYATKACTPEPSVSSRFASACSCAGVTATTATVTPTATVVVPEKDKCPAPKCKRPVSESKWVVGDPKECHDVVDPESGYSCYCFQTAKDGNRCVPDFYCTDVPDCEYDHQCDWGKVCVVDSFCGKPVCVKVTGCENPWAPRAIFRERGDGATGAFPAA